MASAYSSTVYIGGGSSRAYRAYVSASVSSQTDTTATISYSFSVEMRYAYQYGVAANCYVNGSWVNATSGYLTSNPGSSWAIVCSASGTTTVSKKSSSFSCPVQCNAWGEEVNGYGSAGGSTSASVSLTIPAITYYAPAPPIDVTNTRNTDTKNTITWTTPISTTTKPVSSIKVERSVDGGSWSEIASVSGTTSSYSDAGTSADHSYQYRVRTGNSAGYSDYATSNTTYNTPSAPTSITASRLAEATVGLSISNEAKTATALELQRSTDQSTWESVATIEGSPVTAAQDEPGGGTFWYRARNTRDNLVSAWSPVSNAVVTICAPNAPTLVTPASGITVSMATLAITFSWSHSPVDGSAQTEAELRYHAMTDAAETADDIAWTTVSVSGSGQSIDIDNAFEINSVVTWSVRTKGAHEDFGPWSSNRVFYLRQQPSVSFAEPGAGFIVENTPIRVRLQYDDASGVLANATLTVSNGTSTVYTLDMGTSTEADIFADDWLPDNKASYTLSVAVRSSSTLSSSAARVITVDFTLPQPAHLDIDTQDDTGYASIFVGVDESEGLAEASSISVYRVSDGNRVLLGSGLGVGSGLVDKYAPLNTDYVYEAVSFADSGAVNTVTFKARLDTSWAFVYFANGMARGMWNPQTTYQIEPTYKLVHTSGESIRSRT